MKRLLALATSASAYLSTPLLAFAQTEVPLCPPGDSPFNPACFFDLSKVVGPFITLVFILAVIVALFYLVWGAFKWITSGGDKAAVQAAREHIVAAIVGLVLVFLAYFILSIIIRFLFPGATISDPNFLIIPSVDVTP